MKYISIILLILMALPITAAPVNWEWQIPTEGSPVIHYEMQIQTDGLDWLSVSDTSPTNSLSVDMPDGISIVRVRGVDSQDRPGPWSEPSDAYTQLSSPGICGKPTIQ
jgi:hypothetical protein